MGKWQGLSHNQAGWVAITVCMIVLLMSGCASMKAGDSGSDTGVTADKNAPLYYDFGDVLVPRAMKVDKNASFVFRTAGPVRRCAVPERPCRRLLPHHLFRKQYGQR